MQPAEELPDCPYCHHHEGVEKVSALVERAFPVPPGDSASILKEYRLVKWGGKSYFVKKRYFEVKNTKPLKIPWLGGLFFLLFFAKSSSIIYLFNALLKSLGQWQVYQRDFTFEQDGDPKQATEITALMLLPVIEKPAPLPANSSLKRYLLETGSFFAWRYLFGLAVLALGFYLHLVILIVLAGLFLLFQLFLNLLGALVFKLLNWGLEKYHSYYREKVKKLPKAFERWQRLYYCHLHDGVFTAEGKLKFTHVKRARRILFD